MHDAGRKVSTWTVDIHEDMTRMADAGVDAIVSNEVAALVAFAKSPIRLMTRSGVRAP